MQKHLHIGRFVVVMLHLEQEKHSVITKQTIYNMKIKIICMVYNIHQVPPLPLNLQIENKLQMILNILSEKSYLSHTVPYDSCSRVDRISKLESVAIYK